MEIGQRMLPRILTQVSRDPGTPFYGSCDRNWWHYKVRDFSSIILQQAGYAIAVAAETNIGRNDALKLKVLAAATCRFWNKRALLHGAFEEYYPYEQGYPPLAFSTLAIAKLCNDGVIPLADIRPGLEIASNQLLTRFEAEAANQQVAGAAALAVIRKLAPRMVPESDFQNLLHRTLDLQTSEGWFPEYDGPDLGYLSVTMDCLWDIYDATGDKQTRCAIDAAFDYLAWFVLGPIGLAGMHNARNTDYIVPYGIARLACEDNPLAERASKVMAALFSRNNQSSHFFDAVDDRYWCHYIGHSVFRTISILSVNKKNNKNKDKIAIGYELPRAMLKSGHFLLGGNSPNSPEVLVSARKGAIFTVVWPSSQKASDFGWIVDSGKQIYVSHWWSLYWSVAGIKDEVECTGPMVPHREHISIPWKHIILRIASFIAGRRIISVLKKMIIFKKSNSVLMFCRRVVCDAETVTIYDKISGIRENDKLIRAPRSSKRHVASADSFHPEDFCLINKVSVSEKIERKHGEVTIITRYVIDDHSGVL